MKWRRFDICRSDIKTIGIVIIFGFLCLKVHAEWEWVNPYPTGSDLTDIWESPEGHVYITGDNGTLLRGDVGNWQLMDTGKSEDWMSICGAGDSDFTIAGSNGTVIHWNGSAWEDMGYPGKSLINKIVRFDDGRLLTAGGEYAIDGEIYYWNLTEWIELDPWPYTKWDSRIALTDLWVESQNNIYAVGRGGVLVRWDTQCWHEIDIPTQEDINAIWGRSANDYFVVGGYVGGGEPHDGIIYHWDGSKWTHWLDSWAEFYDVTGSDDEVIVTGTGRYYHYIDGTWTLDTDEYTGKALLIRDEDVLSVSFFGVILKREEGVWQESSTATTKYIFSMQGYLPEDFYLCGASATLLHYAGGQLFPVDLGFNYNFSSVWENKSALYLLGNDTVDGVIIKWDGTSFFENNSKILNSIWGYDSDHIYCVGGSYYDLDYWIWSWDGIEWRESYSGSGFFLREIHGTDPDNIYASGSDGHLLHWNGNLWEELTFNTSYTLESVFCYNENLVIAAGGNAVLVWDGSKWTDLSLEKGYYLEKAWGDSIDNIFVCGGVGIEGFAFHWDGISWSDILMPGMVHQYCLWKQGDGDLFSAGAVGQVLKWTDSYPLGVRISMPPEISPGETFQVRGYLDNPGAPLKDVPVFFILDIYGELWFWDNWVHYDSESEQIDFVTMNIPTGSTIMEVVPPFEWPDTGNEKLTGLYFYGAMLNPEMNNILGNWAAAEWKVVP